METENFNVRTSKRRHLKSKFLKFVQHTLDSLLGVCLRSRSFEDLKCTVEITLDRDAAIKPANWDTSKACEKLQRNIETYVTSVRTKKLSELLSLHEVPPARTLRWPFQTRAMRAQEAHRRNINTLCLLASAFMLILVLNEFMTLLRNFVYLVIILVPFLLGMVLLVELDASGVVQSEILHGILVLAIRFLRTVLLFLGVDSNELPAALDARGAWWDPIDQQTIGVPAMR